MTLFGPKVLGLRHGDVLEISGARVVLKANPRARRVSLRVDRARGEVIAVAPSERRLGEAVAFAWQRAAWIALRLSLRAEETPFSPGGQLMLRGRSISLEARGNASAARLVDDGPTVKIVSGGEGQAFARRVEALLRREALKDLTARTEAHTRALGLPMPHVNVTDPSSRWGSCTPARGAIRYSWRLIMAPPFVLDYVSAHEVAHLVRADHSPAFWGVVKSLITDERAGRRWLKANGHALHAAGRSRDASEK